MKFINKRYFFTAIATLILASCHNKKIDDVDSEIFSVENGLRPAIHVNNEKAIRYNILDRMKHYKVPGVSIALVEGGKLKWTKAYGVANTETNSKVTTETLFQAGSISKPVAALAALNMVEQGNIDLDVNVNEYLTDWKIEDNEFTQDEKVTLRRLLSHSAGTTVHGFPGYKQNEKIPSTSEVLEGKGNTAKVEVNVIPGSDWKYSGGGYTIMQKVVEDVSKLPFEEYMDKHILKQMDMKNSTFDQPLISSQHTSISSAYDFKGNVIDGHWHNYPEKAAAGLWTTATDLAKYNIKIYEIYNDKNQSVISNKMVNQMLSKQIGSFGLGLFLKEENENLIYFHGGKNAGFTNEMIGFVNTGNALVVMTNADNGGNLIQEIYRSVSACYDWRFKEQRNIDVVNLPVEKLKRIQGSYKYHKPVPGVGGYIIDLTIEGNNLILHDKNYLITEVMSPVSENKFININSGNEILIEFKNDKPVITIHGQLIFEKIDI